MAGRPLITPRLGDIVVFTSPAGDHIQSPAVVLRTRRATVHGSPFAVPVHELPDAWTVDLLVHGLMRDYREGSVPYDPGHSPRSWSWRGWDGDPSTPADGRTL